MNPTTPAPPSAARVAAIALGVSAVFWAIAWVGLRPVAYHVSGALADLGFLTAALLLWRPLFRSQARVALLAVALAFTFSFSLVLKSSLLGAPVFSSDLSALVALLGVLSGWQWLLAVAVLVVLSAAVAWSLQPLPKRAGWLLPGVAFVAAIVAFAPALVAVAGRAGHRPLEDSIAHYRRDGGVLFLLEDRAAREEESADAPTLEAVEGAAYSVQLAEPVRGARRNVHLVLLESIWDPLKLRAYTFDRDPFDPRFRRFLQASGNSRVLSPVFGSLTANAEFEMLCGLPTSQRVVFFTRNLRQPMPCLPRVLRDSGYLTMASHPNSANFWSRDQAYGRIGFEQYRSLPSFVVDDLDGAYLADASTFRQNLAMLAAAGRERPVFNYVVTLSSHFPYDRNRARRPDRVRVTPRHALLSDYANAASYTTSAFMDWLEQLRRDDPDAIVVAFGDHAPMLGGDVDPYGASGLPISGSGRSPQVLTALSETPLIVVDGRRGVLRLGSLPIKRVAEVITGALRGEPLPASPPGMVRRFQDNLLVNTGAGWLRCPDPAERAGAEAASAATCATARKRDRDQRIVRDDLARGHQYAAIRAHGAAMLVPTAMTLDGDARRCSAEIEAWGPNGAVAGQPFNVQPGGASATWLRAPRRTGVPRLRIGRDEVPIRFGGAVGAASWRNPAFLQRPGRYPVQLLCDGEAPHRLGEFVVEGPHPSAKSSAVPAKASLPARAAVVAAAPTALPADLPVAIRPGMAAALRFRTTVSGQAGVALAPIEVLSAQCLADKASHAALRLRWVATPARRAIEVFSLGPGDAAPTLFARSGAQGQADTGPWVRDGQRFDFFDANSHARLASITLLAPACPR